MNIIEKEIKKREDLIAKRAENLEKIEKLKKECEEIKVDELQKDIDELKTYLPKPDQPDEQEQEQAVDGTGQPIY
ncbi:MAG TPA: hypothetical protein GX745_01880 [Clostridiales bacterium]|nr:hypothetical protein [Clostridiales bacterium]